MTWKGGDSDPIGTDPKRGKARLVPVGFKGTDVGAELHTEAPCQSKLSRSLQMQATASLKMKLWKGDVSCVFLQGDPGGRKLYGQPPADVYVALFLLTQIHAGSFSNAFTDWWMLQGGGGFKFRLSWSPLDGGD